LLGRESRLKGHHLQAVRKACPGGMGLDHKTKGGTVLDDRKGLLDRGPARRASIREWVLGMEDHAGGQP
jgi:hypothetical protein